MDTKLKSSHKLTIFVILAVILIPSLIMIGQYHNFYLESAWAQKEEKERYIYSDEFLESFLETSYVFYAMEKGQNEQEMFGTDNGYDELYPFIDYQIKSDSGKVMDESTLNTGKKISLEDLQNYELGIVISFDETGTPIIEKVTGKNKDKQSIALKRLINELEGNKGRNYFGSTTSVYYWDSPQNRTYIYVMTEKSMKSYFEEAYNEHDIIPDTFYYFIFTLMAVVVAAALLLPRLKKLETGDETVFHVPFEIPVLVFFFMTGILFSESGRLFNYNKGIPVFTDFLIWAGVFAVTYWTAGSLRQISLLGIRKYFKERTVSYHLGKYVKKLSARACHWGREHLNSLYHSLDHMDLNKKDNKIILEIVLINFAVLAVICAMWFAGIIALIIYSVILFFVMNKYFKDLKQKYRMLLEATNELAEGNLDIKITDDLGIFEPFKSEVEKIQAGFKKAVDEEVKSQKMKTELITNVSHDLKTPLTAIITYVNLLKDEKEEEKREKYIQVLEQKSMRLKVLIEDLFEISKASSDNVTLELVNVDIVNLFKQVKLELDDKIQKADLEFRLNFEEEKIVLKLDSQKTYRIFENLLVNVVKYALPHTRVYVDIGVEGGEAYVRIKNISAQELNFKSDEITERFVRGDVSRNTEGSGLGLAIAKSFVELQNGKFEIVTDADLFKVSVRWPYIEELS